MNKIISVAILALLGATSAIKLSSSDDLYDDDDDTRETLKSIETAERAHNVKFNGISKEEEKVLIGSKSSLNFDENETFIANKPLRSNYIGISQEVSYPEARPISEVLLQFHED